MNAIIAFAVIVVSIAADMSIVYRAQARAEYEDVINDRLARYAVR